MVLTACVCVDGSDSAKKAFEVGCSLFKNRTEEVDIIGAAAFHPPDV
jgi:hypothetical protein